VGSASGEVGDSSRGGLPEAGEEAAPDIGSCAGLKRLEDRCLSAGGTADDCCCCCFANAAICRFTTPAKVVASW